MCDVTQKLRVTLTTNSNLKLDCIKSSKLENTRLDSVRSHTHLTRSYLDVCPDAPRVSVAQKEAANVGAGATRASWPAELRSPEHVLEDRRASLRRSSPLAGRCI